MLSKRLELFYSRQEVPETQIKRNLVEGLVAKDACAEYEVVSFTQENAVDPHNVCRVP